MRKMILRERKEAQRGMHRVRPVFALLLCFVWLASSGFTGLETYSTGSLTDGLGVLEKSAVAILAAPESLGELGEGELSDGIQQAEGWQAFALGQVMEWEGKCMANVDKKTDIRQEPSSDGEVAGVLYKGNMAYVLQQAGGWTRIRSGEAEGWVEDTFLAFGWDAIGRAEQDAKKIGTATAELGVYGSPERSTDPLGSFAEGDTFEIGAEENGFFEAVYADGGTAYVPAEYVEVSYSCGEAKTIEDVRAEELKAKNGARWQKLEAVAASADELSLLAALIQAEAGNQPYEGKVAVGAVVMNRVKSGRYPSSILEVISQPGQFTPWGTGRVQSILARGASEECRTAAQAALNGETTVGDCLYFHVNRGGENGIVIGAHIFK